MPRAEGRNFHVADPLRRCPDAANRDVAVHVAASVNIQERIFIAGVRWAVATEMKSPGVKPLRRTRPLFVGNEIGHAQRGNGLVGQLPRRPFDLAGLAEGLQCFEPLAGQAAFAGQAGLCQKRLRQVASIGLFSDP